MAIIKYKDKDGNLQPLGATGDHSHNPEAIGAAAKIHSHDVVDVENNKNGFMSVADKTALDTLNKEIFGDGSQYNLGLSTLVGKTTVQAQISEAIKDLSARNEFTDDEQKKLKSIAENAEVNQNAFSKITVGSTAIDADSKTDNLILVAGGNITLTPDVATGSVTIAADDTTYDPVTKDADGLMLASDKKKLDGIADGATKVIVEAEFNSASENAIQNKTVSTAISELQNLHNVSNGTKQSVAAEISEALDKIIYAGSDLKGGAATSANKVNSSLTIQLNGGTTTDINKFTFNGSAAKTVNITPSSIGAATTSTFTNATTSADGKAGLVPAPTKGTSGKFLSSEGTWATPYTHPTEEGNKHIPAGGQSGKFLGYGGTSGTATWSDIPTASSETLGGIKVGDGLGISSGALSVKPDDNLSTTSANTVKNSVVSTAISELQDLHNIYNGKKQSVAAEISEALKNLNYAASSSVGGNATKAEALTSTSKGGSTQPVYFDSTGKPAACTYSLNKTVPSDAKFTDTHYESKNVVASGTSSTSNTTSVLSNGSVRLNSVENGSVTSSHKISGSGATTVTTDSSGNIVISSTDNNTTYSTFSTTNSGLVPKSTNTSAFLKGDGTWATPTNTTYSVMTGAGSSSAGSAGLVPQPTAGANTKYLRGDGTWQTPPNDNTTYSTFGQNKNGLVPGPSSTSTSYYLRADGTWATPTNTTYSTFSTSSNGLVPKPSSSDTGKFLQGNGTWATPSTTYTLPTASSETLGGIKVGSGLSISNGVLSANTQSITVDSSVTSGSSNAVSGNAVYAALSGKVPTTRTINGKALDSNITLTASELGIQSGDFTIGSIASGQQTMYVVNFNEYIQYPFFVAFVNSCVNGVPAKLGVYSYSLSKNQCQLYVTNSDSTKSATNVRVSWIAIGVYSST